MGGGQLVLVDLGLEGGAALHSLQRVLGVLLGAVLDNQTYRDYFMETALKSAQRDLALAEQAVKDGHTEDEIRDSLDATIASFKSQASSGGYSYGAYLRAAPRRHRQSRNR